jgi:thioredoxin-related protein
MNRRSGTCEHRQDDSHRPCRGELAEERPRGIEAAEEERGEDRQPQRDENPGDMLQGQAIYCRNSHGGQGPAACHRTDAAFLHEEILMRWTTTFLALAVTFCALSAYAGGSPSGLPPAGYDKARDPAADLAAAIPQAQRENKRILLEVGGEWCVYCRILNKVVHEDERLAKRLQGDFIVIKVNFSDDVKNEAFLSRYPEIPSYPHLFLLEADGTFLLSESPDLFMDEDKYVPDKILEFLEKWAPKAKA